MKIITLLPVKNEAWILPHSLENFSKFSDIIIVADQNSDDNTIDICKRFPKVSVINNPNDGHSNQVRWTLLEEARRIAGVNNLIVCLDADELINPNFIQEFKDKIGSGYISIRAKWVQIWDKDHKRTDGVWENNFKDFAFFDDGSADYIKKVVLNDHTSRIPSSSNNIQIQSPILHLQFMDHSRANMKQAWYKCNELISGELAQKINYKYSVADSSKVKILQLDETSKEMLGTINIKYDCLEDWRYNDIMSWFNKYGIQKFEPLDIWNIDVLKNEFIDRAKRIPKPKRFPRLLIVLNEFKNKCKKLCKK